MDRVYHCDDDCKGIHYTAHDSECIARQIRRLVYSPGQFTQDLQLRLWRLTTRNDEVEQISLNDGSPEQSHPCSSVLEVVFVEGS